MAESKYASLASQLGDEPCLCEDTESMFWLRESDDYESLVKLGNALSGQYRFREAVEIYTKAERIRNNDPMLYLRLGGASLSLFRFTEAKEYYDRAVQLSGNEKQAAYPLGVWHYLKKQYTEAAESFEKCLPCNGELEIAIIYWHTLSALRGGFEPTLLSTYREDLDVGHHGAYKEAVRVLSGLTSVDSAEAMTNPLDEVVFRYGVSIFLETQEKADEATQCRKKLLQNESVWPCISYLAAWRDELS